MSIKKTKHLALTLHFTVEVDESGIPTTGVNARPNGTERTGSDEAWREGDERERRLLHTVVGTEELFKSYLRYQVATYLECASWRDWYELLYGEQELNRKKVLDPAVALLSPDDQQYFAGAEEHGVFFEATEIFGDCWHAQVDAVDLVLEGDGE